MNSELKLTIKSIKLLFYNDLFSLSYTHTDTKSLTLKQVIQTGRDPEAAGQEF